MLQRQEGWLDEKLVLPGDYKTTRRDLLKLFPLIGGLGSAYALSQNQKVSEFVTPADVAIPCNPPMLMFPHFAQPSMHIAHSLHQQAQLP